MLMLLYDFSDEFSVKILDPFFNQLVCFLIVVLSSYSFRCHLSPIGTWYLLVILISYFTAGKKNLQHFQKLALDHITWKGWGLKMKLWFVYLQSLDPKMTISLLLTDT